jgi:hypothetical protein
MLSCGSQKIAPELGKRVRQIEMQYGILIGQNNEVLENLKGLLAQTHRHKQKIFEFKRFSPDFVCVCRGKKLI